MNKHTCSESVLKYYICYKNIQNLTQFCPLNCSVKINFFLAFFSFGVSNDFRALVMFGIFHISEFALGS